ncbi:MAG TPA: hypothetical protein ENK52_05360, partial [Saprospiraceae bacterium]|nr:hypothetical protein [Saprospiraceae bacterium]
MRKMLILLTGLLMLFSHSTKAAHIIGGEITYRCFGNGRYQITIKMYRDCYGGGADFDSFTPNLIGQVTVFRGNSPEPFTSVLLDPPKIVNI